jgi:hypothetical protein
VGERVRVRGLRESHQERELEIERERERERERWPERWEENKMRDSEIRSESE